jgi:hypothetical protein
MVQLFQDLQTIGNLRIGPAVATFAKSLLAWQVFFGTLRPM